MDHISKQLVAFATSFSEADLAGPVVARANELLFDTVACAVAGHASEPARIVAKIARNVSCETGATMFGSDRKTSPEIAALANTMMVRTYDYNDAYFGHPSDMIPGVLAAGEAARSSGIEVLTGIALAYEIYAAFARSAPYHLDSWLDQGVFMNVGVALAAGKLWGLDESQLANAASLALVPNLPLGVSRWGALSMMKGCATAFAVRNGVFAALLAREGFTSAPEPYEGIFGLHHAIGKFDLRLPVDPDGMRVVEMAYVKPIPAENNTIGLLELAPEIRAWAPVDAIDTIDIELATGLDVHLADDPKYDPKTRESADHSLPYMLARALVDGEITLDSYTTERVADPSIRPLMRKIRVRGNDDMKALMRASRGPEAKPARIRVVAGGHEFAREILGHSGHPQRPESERRDMLNRKLNLCAAYAGLPEERRESLRQAWWGVPAAADISDQMRTLTRLDNH
jgi:2-methylcitrate dehydratase